MSRPCFPSETACPSSRTSPKRWAALAKLSLSSDATWPCVEWACRFREGKVLAKRSFADPEHALEAVRQSEQDAHADSRTSGILRGRCRRRTWRLCGASFEHP